MKSWRSWDENEFTEVLEVLPEHDETAEADLFIVDQESTRLEICVLRFEPEVSIHVYGGGSPIPVVQLDIWFDSADRQDNHLGEHLEFTGARMRPEDEPAFTLRVFVKPQIQVVLGQA